MMLHAHTRSKRAAEAFERSDAEASRHAHDCKAWEEDGHSCGSRELIENERIEGAIAGVCCTLVATATLSGVDDAWRIVMVLGIVGSCAHGVRHLLWESWYQRHYDREYARETWELENYAQGEKEEMVGLFAYKGLDRTVAETVVAAMSASKMFFVALMMTEELQLREPLAEKWQRAAAVTASYAVASLGPVLLSAQFAALIDLSLRPGVTFITGLVLLAFLGVRRASMTLLHVYTHAFECVCLGLLCIAGSTLLKFLLFA